MTRFVPVGTKLLVKLEKYERKYKGLIEIPEDVANRQDMSCQMGIVAAMGPDCYKDQPTPWCAVGDRVKFAKFAGFVHVDDDVQYRLMSDLDIMLVEVDDE